MENQNRVKRNGSNGAATSQRQKLNGSRATSSKKRKTPNPELEGYYTVHSMKNGERLLAGPEHKGLLLQTEGVHREVTYQEACDWLKQVPSIAKWPREFLRRNGVLHDDLSGVPLWINEVEDPACAALVFIGLVNSETLGRSLAYPKEMEDSYSHGLSSLARMVQNDLQGMCDLIHKRRLLGDDIAAEAKKSAH